LKLEYYIINSEAVTFSDPQITKDWLYHKIIIIKKVSDSIILVFSPLKLAGLINYGYEMKE
jgi:hypothetical protein